MLICGLTFLFEHVNTYLNCYLQVCLIIYLYAPLLIYLLAYLFTYLCIYLRFYMLSYLLVSLLMCLYAYLYIYLYTSLMIELLLLCIKSELPNLMYHMKYQLCRAIYNASEALPCPVSAYNSNLKVSTANKGFWSLLSRGGGYTRYNQYSLYI